MGYENIDEYELQLEDETTFNDETGLFSGSESVVKMRDGTFNRESINRNWIEDTSVVHDGGSNRPIPGTSFEVLTGIPVGTYAEGLGGSGAGDGVAATETGFTKLLASSLQDTPQTQTGSTVAAGTTTTSLVEADAGNHEPSDTFGLIAVVMDDGSIEVVPTNSYSTDTATLLMELSGVPTTGNTVPGGVYAELVDKWTAAVAYSLGMRFIGNDSAQNRKLLGAVSNFSIPAVQPEQVPVIDWQINAAQWGMNFSDSKNYAGSNRGKVLAGSELKLAALGETSFDSPKYHSASFSLGRAYQPDSDGTDDDGICGWSKSNTLPEFTLTVAHDVAAPSNLTSSSSTFYDSLVSEDDSYHLLWNLGRVMGRGFALYFPDCHLHSWQPTTIREKADGQQLMFQANADTQKPQVCFLVY